MTSLNLFAAKKFLDAFDRADIKLQCLIRGSLQDMANRFQSAPKKVWSQYQKWEGFDLAGKRNELDRILEVEVTGSVRLLVGVATHNVYLLDVGKHDIELKWDKIKNKTNWLKSGLAGIESANNLLIKGSENPFVSLAECEGWSKYYPAEDTSEWVTFLDTKQYEVVMKVTEEIEEHLLGDRKRDCLWLIVGGPGTGKTVVLLKILQKLLCSKLNVGFSCSDAVYSYLESATGCIIPRWDSESTDDGSLYDVLLYDDPGSLDELLNRPRRKNKQPPRALVYAFDPLQLSQMPTSDKLDSVISKTKASVHELSTCFRQREKLAEKVTNMTDVLAKSSPYLRQDKIADFAENYSDLLTRFNNPEFCYPLGEYRVYHKASIDTLRQRIDELYEKPGLWTHSPPLLLVIDEQLKPEFALYESEFKSTIDGDVDETYLIVWSNQVEDIKGVDFQHVVILLSEPTLAAVQEPFQGSGSAQFNSRRLLRISFSRARDSLSLVVWNSS